MNPSRRKSQRRRGEIGAAATTTPGPSSPSARSRSWRRALHLTVAVALLSSAAVVPPGGSGGGHHSFLLGAHAYVTSGLPAHTHRAFLRRLTDEICTSDPGTLTPQEVSNAPVLMSAWADAPDKLRRLAGGESGRERALAVEALLKRIIDERRAGNVDAIAKTEDYNAVMKSWVMSGEGSAAAQRVEQILLNMQDMYSAGDQDVQPNAESFQLAIESWTKATDEPDALARAQRILDWMTNIYLAGANDLAAPETSCFLPLLKGWATSGKLEAPIMAEQLIMRMQHLQTTSGIHSARPDTMCFNIVMSSWLKSRDVTSEKRIRQIFEYMDMCRRRGSDDIRPDSASYNLVISSIGPAVKRYHEMGGARRADRILARLEGEYLAGGEDPAFRPDTIIYNQVIDYWAKTQSAKGHFLRAREVLDRQIDMYEGGVRKCRPDVMSYTSVIAACASTYGSKMEKRRSFDLAHATFMEACRAKHTQPNDVTYGLMFKAVGRLLPGREERDRYTRTLFGLCCDDGHLGEMGYNRMGEAVTGKLMKELTGGRRYVDLPQEWKRNARTLQRKPPTERRSAKKKNDLRP